MLQYTDGGLQNIWLKNGYTEKTTPYGKALSIHDVDGLTKIICLTLCKKSKKLTGKEFRYIRSSGLMMSQDGLGKIIGADVQAIARWEKSGKIPKMADKLIRISYLEKEEGNSSLSHVIKTLNKIERLVNQRIILSETETGGWRSLELDEVAS